MIKSKSDLYEYLKADKIALERKSKKPNSQDVIWKYQIYLRKCEYYKNCRNDLIGKILFKVYNRRRIKIGIKCNLEIPLNVCGKGLSIAHTGPIIINKGARIGEYCRIHACVNIGSQAGLVDAAPIIGNYVYIGPGAKLFGRIEIADNIAVGANAVVNKSFTESGISIAGVPARKISDKGTTEMEYYKKIKALS
ncbi:serine O-acetyltransferase [Acetivibrio clariflavus]|mgnify:CR=1 FL=1|uniref:serine O-acetyltransferase n=1 Tax=Acetivibrio clariflavus TaxID=288965 RepID=UPI0004AFE2E2|nr:serine acetyltransferase [Acetivibrio clariflavus]